jgi:hypothetical protein
MMSLVNARLYSYNHALIYLRRCGNDNVTVMTANYIRNMHESLMAKGLLIGSSL